MIVSVHSHRLSLRSDNNYLQLRLVGGHSNLAGGSEALRLIATQNFLLRPAARASIPIEDGCPGGVRVVWVTFPVSCLVSPGLIIVTADHALWSTFSFTVLESASLVYLTSDLERQIAGDAHEENRFLI